MPANAAQIQDIFLAAADLLDPGARAEYLDRACGGNDEIRRRVEALLKAHAQPDSLLDVPVLEGAGPETRTAEPTPDGNPESAATRTYGSEADRNPDDDLAVLSPSDRPGSLGRIGHYEVLEVLGRGGFGTVYRAFDDKLQRVVAVKVLSPSLATTSPARKRFLREARATAAIKHDHVVQIYDTQEQPLPYLVMEYVPGETLQQRLDRSGPLDLSEILRIGRQVSEGLAAAHATGLVHRDVKPANVLIEDGPQHRVKLTDFGLARAADDASISHSGIVAGTPMYMAPEQAKGDTLDHRADLFSLGSVLYVMATGRPPFRASGMMAVLKRVVEEDPRPIREVIPEIPAWFCRIVEKLHAKKPDDRFQTSREVAEILADCERQVTSHGQLKDFSRIPGGGKPPKNRKVRRLVASLWGIAALFWAAILFGEPAYRYVTNQGAIEVAPETGFTSFILWRDGHAVTNWYDARTRPTITLPPGKYKLEPTFAPGRTVERWELKTRTTFSSRSEWQGVRAPEFEVARGESITLRAVMRDAPDTTATGDSAGWVSLFNGRGLAGWKTAFGVPEGWKFEDGALVGSGRGNCLATRRQDYYDFHLRLEVKISAGGVGHVYSRGPIGFSDGVIETRIADSGTGGLARSSTKLDSPAKPVAVVPNEWFTLDIIAQGDRIETRVNGRLAAQATDLKRLGGPIGLESDTPDTVIHFRKIEIKELPTFTPPVKDGFVSLFNGNDLTGWKSFPPDRTSWTVKNGILTGSGKPCHLFTDRGNFGNFHLRMEMRIKQAAKGGAVGVFARVPVEDPGMIVLPYGKGSQFQLPVPKLYDDQAAPPDPAPPTYRDEPMVLCGVNLQGEKAIIKALPADKWITVEFILDGPHVEVRTSIADQLTSNSTYTGAKTPTGHLALQLFDDWSEVEFRKIEIKELPAGPGLSDKDRLQGLWVAESGDTLGQPLPAEQLSGMQLEFREANVRVTVPGRPPGEGTFKIDPAANPKEIDVIRHEDEKGMRGIYQFDGDKLILCVGDPAPTRPRTFVTGPDTGSLLRVTLRRATPSRSPAVPKTAAEVLPFLAGNWKVEMQTLEPKQPPDAVPPVGHMTLDYVAGRKVLRSRASTAAGLDDVRFLYSFDPDKNVLRQWQTWANGNAYGPIMGLFNPDNRTMTWRHKLNNNIESITQFDFVNLDTIRNRLVHQDASGTVVREMRMTFTRIPGPIELSTRLTDPNRPAEMKILDRFVGDWRTDMTATIAAEPGKPRAETARVTAASILGGRFLERTETNETYGGSVYSLAWFDADKKRYRQWYFSSAGDVGEISGTWDEATRTLTESSPDEGRFEGQTVFRTDDRVEFRRVFKATDGKKLFEATGESRRVPTTRPPEVPRTAVDVLPYLAGNWKAEVRVLLPKPPPDQVHITGEATWDWVAGGKILRQRGGPVLELGFPHTVYSHNPDSDSLRRWSVWSVGITAGPIPGAWNPETRTLLWMHRYADNVQSNIAFHFADADTFTARLYRQDAVGKILRETHITFTRMKNPISLPSLPTDPNRPAEMKVLDRLAGTWRSEGTVAGDPKNQMQQVKAESILGGRAVEVIETGEVDKKSDYVLVWYDVEAKRYRQWIFDSRGDVTELRGTWDEAAKTIAWASQDGRSEGRWVFKGDDLREYRHLVKHPDGKVLSEVSGVSRRVDSKRPSTPAPDPAVVQPLKDLVAAKERLRNNAKIRYDATLAPRMEVILAEVDLIEARVKLAEAESDRVAVIAGLKELVAYREEERGQVGERVKVGASPKSDLDSADAKVAEAKVRLAEAEKKRP